MLKNSAYMGMAAFGKTRAGPLGPRLRAQRGRPLQPRHAVATRDLRATRSQLDGAHVDAHLAVTTEQALQGFVNQSPWDEQAVLRSYRPGLAQAFAEPSGVIVIDDTGFAKKGRQRSERGREPLTRPRSDRHSRPRLGAVRRERSLRSLRPLRGDRLTPLP